MRNTNMCTPTYMCWPVVLFVHLLPLCPVSESFRRLVKWSARRETDSVRAQWNKLFSWTNIPFNVKYQTQSPTTMPPFWPVHKHHPSLLTLQSTCPQAPSLSQNRLCPICTVKAPMNKHKKCSPVEYQLYYHFYYDFVKKAMIFLFKWMQWPMNAYLFIQNTQR